METHPSQRPTPALSERKRPTPALPGRKRPTPALPIGRELLLSQMDIISVSEVFVPSLREISYKLIYFVTQINFN